MDRTIVSDCLFKDDFLAFIQHQELANISLDLNDKRQLSPRRQRLELAVLKSSSPNQLSLFGFDLKLSDQLQRMLR